MWINQNKMRGDLFRVAAFLFIFFFGAAAVYPLVGYCQNSNATRQIKTANGYVIDIDWVGQTMVVRWLESQGQVTYDEITIFVPDGTKITKGSDTISLSDINMRDQVTVEYRDNSPGPLKAVSIIVNI